jgi:signal peptidase I
MVEDNVPHPSTPGPPSAAQRAPGGVDNSRTKQHSPASPAGSRTPGASTGAQPRRRFSFETLLYYLTFGLEGRKKVSDKQAATTSQTPKLDSTREVIETVVFVVVLVLLLKSFVAEAFVIPTGSMAETLWGYQKVMRCPKCDHQYPVNCSQEVDPQDGITQYDQACTCPNCRWQITDMVETTTSLGPHGPQLERTPKYSSHTGDRVLVAKFLYDLPWKTPERLDVVVFKFPERPQVNYVPMNYIKRLVGKPGETLAIYYGKLYVLAPDKGPRYDDRDIKPEDLWKRQSMHEDEAQDLFVPGGPPFTIVRKPPDKILSMRRLVYDNDHPAKDLKDQPRWISPDQQHWSDMAAEHGFQHAAGTEPRLAWLRYRHVLRERGDNPQLITDFMGYNGWFGPQHQPPPEHWVGDLILECEVKLEKAAGQYVMELSRGTDRFRACWDLTSGTCTLRHIKRHLDAAAPADNAGDDIGSAATSLKTPGSYRLRFANVDNRLLVWVNRSLPFGEGVSFEPSSQPGPYTNDLQPASLGVTGTALQVRHLKLWRDTYYTKDPNRSSDYDLQSFDGPQDKIDWSDPATWKDLRNMKAKTLYIHPGHYLCMGDNSPESSDGRSWGQVPQRLLLGRALVVYYPFYFPVWPLDAPVNRIGAIE